MNSFVTVALVLVAVGYVVVKRLAGEPLNARDLVGPPLILTGVGIYQLTKVTGLVPVDFVWLAGSVIIGIAFGALRGTTIRIFTRQQVLWQRYTGKTFAIWVVSLVAGGGFSLLAESAGMHSEAKPIMLSIGVGMIGEMATVGLRALSTGRRFSPDRKDSAVAHRHVKEHFVGGLADRVRPSVPPVDSDGELTRSPRLRDSILRLSESTRTGYDRR